MINIEIQISISKRSSGWAINWRWGGQSRIFNFFPPNLTRILSLRFWFLLYLGKKREWLWRFSGVSAEAIYFVLTFMGRGGPEEAFEFFWCVCGVCGGLGGPTGHGWLVPISMWFIAFKEQPACDRCHDGINKHRGNSELGGDISSNNFQHFWVSWLELQNICQMYYFLVVFGLQESESDIFS